MLPAMLLLLSLLCAWLPAASAVVCSEVGANCQQCLQVRGCDYCELTSACFAHGHAPGQCALPINLRSTSAGETT